MMPVAEVIVFNPGAGIEERHGMVLAQAPDATLNA